jgi:transposase
VAEAHPLELRERVVEAYEAGGGSYSVIAARFAIGEASVKRWVRRKRRGVQLAADRKRGGTPSTIAQPDVDAIIARMRDATANEITAEFNRHRRGRARVHVSSMKRALHRYGYVVKKNGAGRWSVCGPTS